MTADDVLDAMQDLILEHGRPPSLAAIASALGRTKQAVLHYFPDRAALDRALALRALRRVDDSMTAAAEAGRAAETYLRMSVPAEEDRAVALLVLASLRSRSTPLVADIDAAVARWTDLIAREVGSAMRAEVIRLVGDALFVEALVGTPPPPVRVEALTSYLLGPALGPLTSTTASGTGLAEQPGTT